MELSEQQQIAFNIYKSGMNLFITGPGGSGKSQLIRYIQKDADKKIQVCALTGCAAVLLNCNAKTLHSWAGIGLGTKSVDELAAKINRTKKNKISWLTTDILIIDEISMLSIELFDKLNAIGKIIRKNTLPFGGIQIIMSGDFYQLPPICKNIETSLASFCFKSDDWNDVIPKSNIIRLDKIFRQTDPVFIDILQQIRCGKLTRTGHKTLSDLVNREKPKDVIIKPTKIFPRKSNVEQTNQSELNNIIGHCQSTYLTRRSAKRPPDTFLSYYTSEDVDRELTYLENNVLCPDTLNLKIGAQVMCAINILDEFGDIIICNGSQGVVIGYDMDNDKSPIVEYLCGVTRIMTYHSWVSEKIPWVSISQVPLILAWALTIHKLQGATLDMAEIDVGAGIFEYGQTYVALSRVRSMDGLYLTSFDVSKIKIHPQARQFYQELEEH